MWQCKKNKKNAKTRNGRVKERTKGTNQPIAFLIQKLPLPTPLHFFDICSLDLGATQTRLHKKLLKMESSLQTS
jgi:hypothetical protein